MLHVGTLNSKILFRKKAVCDFSNEAIPNAIHINNDYNSSITKDPVIFRKYTGMYTNTYDAAHRFGIDKPFKLWLTNAKFIYVNFLNFLYFYFS